jgi:hypothetical protein
MKTYNTKLGVLVFTIAMALDVALYLLMHSRPDNGWLRGLWTGINLPGIPVFRFFSGMLQVGSSSMTCLFFGSTILSLLIWSLIVGIIFRRKNAA